MKKSTWGPIFWRTLHCLVIKIHDQHFENEREIIIRTIERIIGNLPCPVCSEHAKGMIKQKNETVQNETSIDPMYF